MFKNYTLPLGILTTIFAAFLYAVAAVAQTDATQKTDTGKIMVQPNDSQRPAPAAPLADAETGTSQTTATVSTDPSHSPVDAQKAMGEGCFPNCRDGFLCHAGNCISACNPICDNGEICTAAAQCVPKPAPVMAEQIQNPHVIVHVPPPMPGAAARHEIRMKYRKAPRLMFSSDIAGGTLKDSDIDEVSFHLGLGFRKNLVDRFGFMVRTNLILGYWEDTTVSESDRDYDAIYSTRMRGFDAELMPYAGPIHRFYFGPIVNYRLLRPADNRILVDVEPWYGEDVLVKFPDEQFFSAGLGGGVFLGTREMVNLNWRFLSSFTRRMPFYIQVGLSFDLPLMP